MNENNYKKLNEAIEDCLPVGPPDNWDYEKNLKEKYPDVDYGNL